MLRSSVLLFCVLTTGIAATPLKPWEKLNNEVVQKAWVSIDDHGMASWVEEVEPPEDMDQISFDIDPSMKIWKKVQTGQSKPNQKAEDDVDDLQHPSTEEILKAYDVQAQDIKNNQKAVEGREESPLFEPEEDLDDVYHSELYKYLAPLEMGYKRENVVRPVHFEPEKDEDDLYHADPNAGLVVVPLQPEVDTSIQAQGGRLHLEPEEDMDDIYHKDVSEMIFYNSEAQAAAPAGPILRKHQYPEEDRDGLYHN